MKDLDERVADIERRLALLEARLGLPEVSPHVGRPELPVTQFVSITVSNKRIDHGEYENYIWFDCVYTLAHESKPTRAVKGAIEFMDLFGDVKFRLQVTINDPLAPGRPLANPGIGFTFNQFMPEHQWMLATDLKDMKVRLAASHVIYTDGTSEALA